MMLSSKSRAALQRDWPASVEAEIARRAAAREAEDDALLQLLWAAARKW